MSKVLVLGACSAIASETIKLFAEQKSQLVLVARQKDKLALLAADALARGAEQVHTIEADLAKVETHAEIVKQVESFLGSIDKVLVAYGTLPDNERCATDFVEAEKALHINFISVVSWCTLLAKKMEQQGHGVLAVISSVAGDRGRQSNYIYGAAKGGLSLYLQGLRNRLFAKGVKVVTIKPGFVDTPMTAQFKKGPLFVGPDVVARGIVRAMERGSSIVYLPWFWCFIMLIIKHIPEFIFKRLKL
jgi:decaprenylphospho-beta-D-erythro-pentofuranosid-2-ulose 2-reductase